MPASLHHLIRGLAELARVERPDGLAPALLALGREVVEADHAVLWRCVGDDLVEEAALGRSTAPARRVARATATSRSPRTLHDRGHTWHLVPVRTRTRTWGVLALGIVDIARLPGPTAGDPPDPSVDPLDIAAVLAGWFAGTLDPRPPPLSLSQLFTAMQAAQRTCGGTAMPQQAGA